MSEGDEPAAASSSSKGGPPGWVLAVAVLLVVTLQVVYAVTLYRQLPDWPTRGQFGDLFGAVNALFSGLAFAALIYTVLLQREELRLQRRELELTREELRRQAEAQEASGEALTAQAEAAHRSARLAAITALIAHYREEADAFEGKSYTADDPAYAVLLHVAGREADLRKLLDKMFEEIVEDE